MSDVTKRLEEQATLLFNNVSGWQTNALKRIGRRIKNIKSLSYADLQALNNATIAKQDIDAILKELAALTNQTVPEVRRIYSEMIEQQHEENRQLYDYRNKPFVPFADNKPLQAIVRAYARTTADTMIKLSMTKAKQLGFADRTGNFVPIEKNFIQVLDKAVMSVATGTGDFGSEMRDVLKELGGSGLRIDYGGGVTRRLDTMVRQNLLWGAKQASVEYNEMIGEELGCDGYEIDWHSNPRPSHAFMQGKQYCIGRSRTIEGVYFVGFEEPDPASEEGKSASKALNEYGCLHFKTPIICGVSEPRFSPEELARLNEQNKRTFEIEGKQLTGYEAKQAMRRIETEARKTKDQINILKASGDNTGAQQLRHKVSTLEGKYQKIAQITGIKAQPEKMTVIKTKSVDNSVKRGYNTISGARITDLFSKKARDFAKSYYAEVRNFSTDIKHISENIGVEYESVKKIKNYLFIDDSKFNDITGEWEPFDPDCAIAHSWQRLMLGRDIKPHDMTLIHHELYEMEIKKKHKGISHDDAHEMATQKYNYQKEAEEYYANLATDNKKG